jgi:hypothetical protein
MAEKTELDDSNPVLRIRSKHASGRSRGILTIPRAISLLVAVAIFLALAWSMDLLAQPMGSTEYEIKAAFLYNFAKFVEWPRSAFSDPKQPLGVCVFGRDPFGHTLEEALLGKSIGNRQVYLGRARQVPDLAGCQMVFISAAESSHLVEIISGLRGHSVLLVGESEGFASSGGAIQFVLDQNRVRFAINPDAANRAGLKISSKLLALATIVRDADDNAEAKN